MGMLVVGVIVARYHELCVLDAHHLHVFTGYLAHELIGHSVGIITMERIGEVAHRFLTSIAPFCGIRLEDTGNSLVVQKRNAVTVHEHLGMLVSVMLTRDVVEASPEI